MNKTLGLSRFEYYLNGLEQLLVNAAKEVNPALWLYTNNARTNVFMLEGLSRLYAGLHNKKRFEKIKDHFKLLEDTLGAIDYYDSFAKELAGYPSIPAKVTDYFQGQAMEKIERLNEILTEDKWIGDKANRIKKIRKKLSGADWQQPKEELKSIFNFYKLAILDINEFMVSTGEKFTEMETQVHELRRRLRWLSIYPQALQGLVQLKESAFTPASLQKYLIPEIINSPYNKMPENGDNRYLLLLEKNYFLSLSWLIAELGKLKDEGLKIFAVAESLQQTEGISQQEALLKTNIILGNSENTLDKILTAATSICKAYFAGQNADKLIYGINSIKN